MPQIDQPNSVLLFSSGSSNLKAFFILIIIYQLFYQIEYSCNFVGFIAKFSNNFCLIFINISFTARDNTRYPNLTQCSKRSIGRPKWNTADSARTGTTSTVKNGVVCKYFKSTSKILYFIISNMIQLHNFTLKCTTEVLDSNRHVKLFSVLEVLSNLNLQQGYEVSCEIELIH